MKTKAQHSEDILVLMDLKAGNQSAFKHFYDLYHVLLYRKLLKFVHVDVVAEELLQDLFLKIWEKRELIDPQQSFKAYLYRVAEHLIVDYYRKLAREISIERDTDSQTLVVSDIAEDLYMDGHAQKIVSEAIETLPHQQRTIFRMCKIEGRSYEEVSKHLNISQATVNTHISRATKTVKDYILRHHGKTISLTAALIVVEIAREIV